MSSQSSIAKPASVAAQSSQNPPAFIALFFYDVPFPIIIFGAGLIGVVRRRQVRAPIA